MAQDFNAILEGLERELVGYEQSGKADRAKQVKAEIARVKKILKTDGNVETAVAGPDETPEAKPAEAAKSK